MYFDLSREKLFMLGTIIAAFVVSISFFLFVNGAWALIEHAQESIAMTESNIWYWLSYELPGHDAISPDIPAGDARSIPVLLYHGEGAASNMPTSVFVDQMRALKQAGWTTITMQQYDEWEKGQIQLPDKSFLLTFDDGRKDTYYQADPVLKDMGFNAVMFVITGFSLPTSGKESDFYLNKTELTDMAASGRWELESHGDLDHAAYAVQSTTDLSQAASTTEGHFLSNKFWSADTNRFETNAEFTARVSGDLTNAKQTLDQDFNINVDAFAYPFNDFGQDSVNFPGSEKILDTVVPSLYSYAFYQTWPSNGDTFNYPLINNGPGSSSYMEKRIEPDASWSGTDLIAVLNAGAAKLLPYQSNAFGQEWVRTWGNAAPSAAGLALSVSAQTSGADVFLNGSGWWKNYYVSATLDWQAGQSVSLIARNQNDVTYLSCAFQATSVALEEHFAGGQQELAAAKYAFSGSYANAHLGIAASGNTITCYEDGVPVVSGSAAGLSQGGVGVELWDPTLGTARATLKSISISLKAPAAPSSASAQTQTNTVESAATAIPTPTIYIPVPEQTIPSPAPGFPTPTLPPALVATSTPPKVTPAHATTTRDLIRQFMNEQQKQRAQQRNKK